MVSSISYDPDTQEMVVQWTKGGSGVTAACLKMPQTN